MKTMKEIYNELFHPSLTLVKLPDGKFKAYTDKNTHHCYIDKVYEDLFKDVRQSATKVLEIGIYGGGSLLMWREYFQNAHIYGLDVTPALEGLVGEERISQVIGNAYTNEIANQFPDGEFDIVLDDGPHTLESFILFIQKYLSKVKEGGYLVIEDIYDINLVPELISNVPDEYKENVQVYDLRYVKGLNDDIIFVIKK